MTPQQLRDLADIDAGTLSDERRRAILADAERAMADVLPPVRNMVRDWICPPLPPSSAGNFEVFAMSVARWSLRCQGLVGDDKPTELETQRQRWETIEYLATIAGLQRFHSINADVRGFWDAFDKGSDHQPLQLRPFLEDWIEGGFPHLEVGHKLAAALCLTDVPPELEVRAPWRAWSLVVPPELVGPSLSHGDFGIRRIWCRGVDWWATVYQEGFADHAPDLDEKAPLVVMLRNLIRGACLALHDPEQHRKPGTGASRAKRNGGAPDLSVARFVLSSPVSIDLRSHVHDVLTGKTHAAPRVQFLVRGHWREQAHGSGRALRKTIWIEPFWKGPEDARVLLRTHKLREPNE